MSQTQAGNDGKTPKEGVPLSLDALSPLEVIDVMDRLSRLHDDANVPAALAGLWLDKSEKTLERWRGSGEGPDYTQPGKGQARNQKITYRMGDLRSWRDANKVSSTVEAAKRRGMTFATVFDLVEEHPFLRRAGSDMLIGHALIRTTENLAAMLSDETAEVVWLPAFEAMRLAWEEVAVRRDLQKDCDDLISQCRTMIYAAGERSEMLAG
jgi:hypothetical protein